jgi:hypothetical protein
MEHDIYETALLLDVLPCLMLSSTRLLSEEWLPCGVTRKGSGREWMGGKTALAAETWLKLVSHISTSLYHNSHSK